MWSFHHPLAAFCVILTWVASYSSVIAADDDWFDWTAINPTVDLQYHPCHDGYRCARLQVPLDWLGIDNNNRTVSIAVISLPATVPTDDPTFGGTIITNPGGPGGSGVKFVQQQGRLLQQITDGKKHYEIVGFDPRGVAHTTPNADCSHNRFSHESLLLEKKGIGALDASESGLKRTLALEDAWGRLCENADAGTDIFGYISTASVARDIVEIADRVEEHREKESAAILLSATHQALRSDSAPSEKAGRVLY